MFISFANTSLMHIQVPQMSQRLNLMQILLNLEEINGNVERDTQLMLSVSSQVNHGINVINITLKFRYKEALNIAV